MQGNVRILPSFGLICGLCTSSSSSEMRTFHVARKNQGNQKRHGRPKAHLHACVQTPGRHCCGDVATAIGPPGCSSAVPARRTPYLHLACYAFFPGQGETWSNNDDPYSVRILIEGGCRLPTTASDGHRPRMTANGDVCQTPKKLVRPKRAGAGSCFGASGAIDEAPHIWDLRGVDYRRISCWLMEFCGQ